MDTLLKNLPSLKLTEDKDQQGQDEGKLCGAQQQGGGGDNGEVKVALLNFQSVNNKLPDISRIIRENKLDILLITETWLTTEKEGQFIEEAQSQNFKVHHEMREGRGGGVAILASNDLESHKVQLNPTNTFEHVAAELKHKQWDKPVLFINVYRTAKGNLDQFQTFLTEFQELLNHDEVKRYSKIMVTGDFNIWVDDERKTKTKKFKSLLETNSLVQHVDEPTYKSGHTLDLVISRNVTVSDLIVKKDEKSDRYTVYFNITKEGKTE